MRKQSENIQSFTDIVDQLIQRQQLLTSGLLAAVAAAKSLQSCPTLFDPIDGSPPGSPVPGILAPMNPANNEEQTDNVKFLSTVEKKKKSNMFRV